MVQKRAADFATWLTIAVLSLVVVFVTPALEESRLLHRLIGAALAVPSLKVVHDFAKRWRLRSLAKTVLGEWTYITFPHEPEQRSGSYGFGLMHFFVDQKGTLRYRVALFDDPEALHETHAEGFSVRGAAGRAYDNALYYDASKSCVWLIYRAEYNRPGIEDRTGYLYLDFSNPYRPVGRWASDPMQRTLSAGEMHVTRPAHYSNLLETYHPTEETHES